MTRYSRGWPFRRLRRPEVDAIVAVAATTRGRSGIGSLQVEVVNGVEHAVVAHPSGLDRRRRRLRELLAHPRTVPLGHQLPVGADRDGEPGVQRDVVGAGDDLFQRLLEGL